VRRALFSGPARAAGAGSLRNGRYVDSCTEAFESVRPYRLIDEPERHPSGCPPSPARGAVAAPCDGATVGSPVPEAGRGMARRAARCSAIDLAVRAGEGSAVGALIGRATALRCVRSSAPGPRTVAPPCGAASNERVGTFPTVRPRDRPPVGRRDHGVRVCWRAAWCVLRGVSLLLP
jgi:hypothetical protein